METFPAAVRLRNLMALIAALGLLAALAPPVAADHNEDEDEHAVVCDAPSFDEEFDDFDEDGFDEEEFGGYWVQPGDTVTCTAHGLDDHEDAGDVSWEVEIFGWTLEDFDADEPTVDESDGEADATLEEDGTLVFSFEIPENIFLGFFEGVVTQEGEGELDYSEEFFGVIFPDFIEGDMECAPDPVLQGEDVECVAEGMAEEEPFDWEVQFFTFEGFFDDFFGDEPDEDDFEDLFESDLQGEGTADEEGVGTFGFTVPTDREIDAYLAVAYQEDELYVAFYIGRVEPAEEEDPPGRTDDDDPVTVERPTRVETGAGGTAPDGSSPLAYLLAGVSLAAVAFGARRRSASRS